MTPLRVEQAAVTAVLARRVRMAARPSFCAVVFMVKSDALKIVIDKSSGNWLRLKA